MKIYLGKYRNDAERAETIKIDYYDTWNLDQTLAKIILPCLKQLRDTKQGAPLVEDSDVPDELKSTSAPPKEHEWDTDANHFKRWDWVLEEMIWAFEQINIDWDRQYHSGEMDIQFEELPEKIGDVGFYKMVRGPNDTHIFDKDGYNKHLNRMQNGFRLFGVYYMSLWD